MVLNSRINLPKIKDGAYLINLDECKSIGTHLLSLYVNDDILKHILKEIKEFIRNKNITTNIFRIQTYDSVMCGYFCTRFIWLYVER